ncbi:hypothetical protein [Paracidovorax konjaci]|uniref:hypothetical protein n=1 Tax=Paracidovorax konjaci TaxID=32040 RepID=UPI0011137E3D|nr:hypothetical protein [Paracidovorax konjaci]
MRSAVIVFVLGLHGITASATGHVENANLNNFSGWACQSEFPDATIGIHILRDDSVFLAGGNAALPRESEVGAVCRSIHPNHGFNINWTPRNELMDGKWHDVRIYLIKENDGGSEELQNSPVRIYFGNGTPPPAVTTPYYVGYSVQLPPGSHPGNIPFTSGWPCGTTCTKDEPFVNTNSFED